MRSLVVEDETNCRVTLVAMLSSLGPCSEAVDGIEALERVEEALASHDYFDLICLDIRMPRMDGQEALKGIRQLEERAGIQLGDGAKIIMTTAFGDTRNIFTAFRENAEGYLTKPVTRDALLTQLGKLGLNERAP